MMKKRDFNDLIRFANELEVKEYVKINGTYYNDLRKIDMFYILADTCEQYGIDFYLKENERNIGVVSEAVLKSYIEGAAKGKSPKGSSDINTARKNYELKVALFNSSSHATPMADINRDDVLLLTQEICAFIPREALDDEEFRSEYMQRKKVKNGYKYWLKATAVNSKWANKHHSRAKMINELFGFM